MQASPRTRFLYVSLLVLLFTCPSAIAQTLLPSDGITARYIVSIDMSRGYVSGIGIMKNEGERLVCSVFNEFGVSAIDFSYDLRKHKVKLLSVMDMLDKWYIRRVLRKDLRSLIENLNRGETTYENVKRHISYRFTPMGEEVGADF